MHEIEVKAKVRDFENLLKRFDTLSCKFSKQIKQDDYIYVKKGTSPSASKVDGNPVLRLRIQDGHTILTLKQDRSGELDCLEKEVEIGDILIMKEILNLLGFEKVVEVHKLRRRAKYKDLEICLDEVQDLGNFVEVEKISKDDGKKVQAELFSFLKTMGISEKDRVFSGYDSLLFDKLKNKNHHV